MGRGCDGRDIKVVVQLNVVVWRLHDVEVKTLYDGGQYSTVSHAIRHATTCGCCLFGRMFQPSNHTRRKKLLLQGT
jgi:hypothetical protein